MPFAHGRHKAPHSLRTALPQPMSQAVVANLPRRRRARAWAPYVRWRVTVCSSMLTRLRRALRRFWEVACGCTAGAPPMTPMVVVWSALLMNVIPLALAVAFGAGAAFGAAPWSGRIKLALET